MEDFNLITVDTLNKYFDILSKAGYVKNKEVNKVIILTFLSRLLNDFSEYITEEDYNDIIKSVLYFSFPVKILPIRKMEITNIEMLIFPIIIR